MKYLNAAMLAIILMYIVDYTDQPFGFTIFWAVIGIFWAILGVVKIIKG